MNSSQAQTVDVTPLCYESVNRSCVKTVYPLHLRMSLYLFFSSVVIITISGNLFVIVTISHFKQLHTPTNYLVLSLAVTDLLLGGLQMPPNMISFVETCRYLGNLFCKVHNSFGVTLCTASIINLFFISIDRYYAVCHPLLYHTKITPFITGVMISVCWSVSVVIGFGIMLQGLNIQGAEDIYYENIVCYGGCVFVQSAAANTAASILAFYLPGILMIFIYMKIFRIARKQAKSVQDWKSRSSTQSVLSKEERKATVSLAVILGVFLSLWAPFFICNIINPFISNSVAPLLFDLLVWIGYMNSTCNPVVYAFFYKWFRKAFRMTLSGQIFQPGSSRMNLHSH